MGTVVSSGTYWHVRNALSESEVGSEAWCEALTDALHLCTLGNKTGEVARRMVQEACSIVITLEA